MGTSYTKASGILDGPKEKLFAGFDVWDSFGFYASTGERMSAIELPWSPEELLRFQKERFLVFKGISNSTNGQKMPTVMEWNDIEGALKISCNPNNQCFPAILEERIKGNWYAIKMGYLEGTEGGLFEEGVSHFREKQIAPRAVELVTAIQAYYCLNRRFPFGNKLKLLRTRDFTYPRNNIVVGLKMHRDAPTIVVWTFASRGMSPILGFGVSETPPER